MLSAHVRVGRIPGKEPYSLIVNPFAPQTIFIHGQMTPDSMTHSMGSNFVTTYSLEYIFSLIVEHVSKLVDPYKVT